VSLREDSCIFLAFKSTTMFQGSPSPGCVVLVEKTHMLGGRAMQPLGAPITTVATRRGRARHHPLQNRSADPAFCLATEHLVAVRARRPRLHGQAPRPPHRLEARSPHHAVPHPSFRQRRQSGHKNAPSWRFFAHMPGHIAPDYDGAVRLTDDRPEPRACEL
jgi:hypothetical protein